MRRPRRRLGAREGGPGRVCGPYVVGVFWFRFFSVSSSASACFCFAAKRISTANSPENAHWFFSLSRMVSCGLSAPGPRRNYFRLPVVRDNGTAWRPFFFLVLSLSLSRSTLFDALSRPMKPFQKKQARSTTSATPTLFLCSNRKRLTASTLSCGELGVGRRGRERERGRRIASSLARHWRRTTPPSTSLPLTLTPLPTQTNRNSAATPPSSRSPESA